MITLTASLKDLSKITQAMRELSLGAHTIFLLQGEVASGKTTLIQAFVKAQGINDPVTSPTFSLLHTYGQNIYHYDLYLKELDELLALNLLESLESEGIHLVEWGSEALRRMLISLGFKPIIIEITPDQEERNYKIHHA